MSLLDLFRPLKKHDDKFGNLAYRRRRWTGNVIVSGLCDEPIRLEIQAVRDADLTRFYSVLQGICENSTAIKDEIAVAAFDVYCMYTSEDRRTGVVSETEFSRYPAATSARDIWNVLRPKQVTLGDGAADWDAFIELHVNWPNPHYFLAYLNNARLFELDVCG